MGTTKLFVGALGMGLAFAPEALYPYYVHHARVWALSAHDDQSIAGLVMAVEQSLVMGVALVVLFMRALASQSASRSARSATSSFELQSRRARLSRIPTCPAIAPIRIDSEAISVPGNTMLSRSCAPSPIGAVAEHERAHQTHPLADLHVATDPHGPSTSVSSRSGDSPATITPGAHLLALDLQSQLARERVEGALAQLGRASRRRSSTPGSRGCGRGRRSRAASGRRPGPSPRTAGRGSSRRSRGSKM